MTAPNQIRHAFPAYRVFVFGQELTEDVFSVEINYNSGREPNTCSVTLNNEYDRYILTYNELGSLFSKEVKQIINDRINEEIGDVIESVTTEQVVGFSEEIASQELFKAAQDLQPEIKRQIVGSKIIERLDGVEQPDIAGKLNSNPQLIGSAFRYPLQAEDPIFHPNDPVRVFQRDPFRIDRWYHVFCGFLSDMDDHVDENNQRVMTLVAEGPSKILRYARITTNPGIIDIKAVELLELDAAFRSAYVAGFKNLTLPELLFGIIFGNDPDEEFGGKFFIRRKTAEGNSSTQAAKLRGVGNFNYSRSVMAQFGGEVNESLSLYTGIPTIDVDNLAEYQSLIDHEVKPTDIFEMAVEEFESDATKLANEAYTDAEGNILIDEVVRIIGSRSDIYPVDGGRLILLVPKSLHPEANREILLKDVVGSFALNTEFQSRLSIIYDTIERIEFMFYESPKGDLICEFPLYDFNPNDFGTEPVEHFATKNNGPFASREETSLSRNVKRGPFGPRWKIRDRDTYNFSKGVTDEKVRTQIAVPWNLLQNYNETGTSEQIFKPSVVTLRHLLPLYWARLEQGTPKGFMSTPEAALVYANILLNRMNADARSIGINALPNLGAWVNRPIFFEPRNCFGTLTSVTHSTTWGMGGSQDTRLNINYIRGWDGLLDENNNPVYTTVGGTPSRPFDYKTLFNMRSNAERRELNVPGNLEPIPDTPKVGLDSIRSQLASDQDKRAQEFNNFIRSQKKKQ